jgi:hypothetical protein
MKKFGIDAATTDQGLIAVSAWFERYGGLLLHFQPYSAVTLHAFLGYDPPWTGEHFGINVVWDLAIYVGECVMARRPSAYWDLNTGGPSLSSRESVGFQRPHLAGLYWPSSCDPFFQVFTDSKNMSPNVRVGFVKNIRPDNLADHVTVWSRPNPPNPASAQKTY